MIQREYNEILQKLKEKYFGIGSIKCPVLEGQKVFFNRIGFRHFLRTKRGIRPISDQIRRFHLFLMHIPNFIFSKDVQVTYSNRGIHDKSSSFIILSEQIQKEVSVKVIIRKNKAGTLYFISIMDF
ncbi:MAG: hypothetical protein KGJ35_01785 [Patescibacteria group bacterium]|nr:hypothetical protein [Patescibacteria group bacterium]